MNTVCVLCHRTDMGNRWELHPVREPNIKTVCPECIAKQKAELAKYKEPNNVARP